jgi:hypothetical protein
MLYIEKSGSPGSEASNYENETRFYGFFFAPQSSHKSNSTKLSRSLNGTKSAQWFESRVTRLGDFSPTYWPFFTSAGFLNYRSMYIKFWCSFFHDKSGVSVLDKKWFGTVCDFFSQTYPVTLFERFLQNLIDLKNKSGQCLEKNECSL